MLGNLYCQMFNKILVYSTVYVRMFLNLLEKRDLESKTEPNVQSSQNSTASTEEAKKEEPEEPKTVEVTASTIDATTVYGEPVKQ
ncbi:hypothetical protein QYM36_017608 [Artemia franciscana]|uniref:Uncharacterized protein n=1 Tax=Artemia franciscana TaxID=6661 RepID=A0AA88KVN7_ARTSF|nr:hypothetical protein QYM36_017608 [Artemia franciscana]